MSVALVLSGGGARGAYETFAPELLERLIALGRPAIRGPSACAREG